MKGTGSGKDVGTDHLVTRCSQNNSELNALKTVEMVSGTMEPTWTQTVGVPWLWQEAAVHQDQDQFHPSSSRVHQQRPGPPLTLTNKDLDPH